MNTENIKYVGVNDKTLDLFESQYIVPNGISYNSYIILDDKITIMDTVDKRAISEWEKNVEKALDGRKPDYLVISHLEPDHSSGIEVIVNKYPNMKIIVNQRSATMLPQFVATNLTDRIIVVNEETEIDLGTHKLKFIMAPMVHWPEVMFTYESSEKILFSADAFGKFGSLDIDEDWDCEARRYYFNIVGKYGMQVQTVLKKVANLEVESICPLHGPILTENLEHYINKYDIWSSYKAENKGILIAYNSIHGNTEKVVQKLAEILKEMTTEKIVVSDLSREDMAEIIEDAFRYDKMVIAAPTYDAGLFPATEDFLNHLKNKNFQNRKVAVIENGSWAPMAGKIISTKLQEMKDIIKIEPTVTIKTTMTEQNIEELKALAKNILS